MECRRPTPHERPSMKRSGSHLFCARHRSHFCPCTGAIKYRDQAKAMKKWDAWLVADTREREEKRERANAS